MTPLERATAAVIADLRRQSEMSGCAVDDNGRLAQVDGSFQVEPLVRAVLEAIREPSAMMFQAGLHAPDPRTVGAIPPLNTWQAMIDAALAEN